MRARWTTIRGNQKADERYTKEEMASEEVVVEAFNDFYGDKNGGKNIGHASCGIYHGETRDKDRRNGQGVDR